MGELPDILHELHALLTLGPGEDPVGWARCVCRASRCVHIHVWSCRPSDQVVHHFIDFLESSVTAIKDVRGCEQFSHNWRVRIESLREYLRHASFPTLDALVSKEEARLLRKQMKMKPPKRSTLLKALKAKGLYPSRRGTRAR